MEIHINGEVAPLPPGHTVAELVARLDLAGQRIAVEVNEQIVPRSDYDRRVLNPGDRVEVVTAIGGG